MCKRVAIIGAGLSGLAQIRAFQSTRKNGFAITEIGCFERQNDRGVLWNDTWRTGLDDSMQCYLDVNINRCDHQVA